MRTVCAASMALHALAARAAAPPALTTTFTPSPSCTIDIYDVADTSAGCVAGTVPVACHYYQLGVTTPNSNCLPPGWSPSSTAFFSPGLVCPQGYTTACSSVTTVDGGAKETRATCCPSAYSCQTGDGFPWYTSDLCVYAIPETITIVYTSSQPGVGYITSSAGGGGQAAINAYGVEIRFRASDLAALTTPSPSSSSTTTTEPPSITGPRTAWPAFLTAWGTSPPPWRFSSPTAAAGTGPATSAAASTNTPLAAASTNTTPNAAVSNPGSASPSPESSTSGGLSTGAKAGIGIGVAAAALILAGAAAVVFRRRRRRNSTPGELPGGHPPAAPEGYYGQPGGFPPSSAGYASPGEYGLPAGYEGAVQEKPELSGVSAHYPELPGTSPAMVLSHELSNEAVYTEMAA